ncbi:hypothetical protein SAMN05518861_101587 [Mesorhizobium sp. YR577]|nr:hypothetical protein SAMN05518861_101587 [Mesorhizobium sp. YR577]
MRVLNRLLLSTLEQRVIDGVIVGASNEEELDRVAAALRSIRQHDPIRYNRLIRDLDHILVLEIEGAVGRFNEIGWLCKLSRKFVSDPSTTPALLASVIVHEATHARLWRMGFGYDEPITEKVERICLRREIAFAAKVPGGIPGQWAEASLATLPDYSDAAVLERTASNLDKTLLALGCPGWLTKVLVAFGRLLHRWRSFRKSRR